MRTRSHLLLSLVGTGALLLLLLLSQARAQEASSSSQYSDIPILGYSSSDRSPTEPALPTNTKIPHARTYVSALIAQADAVAAFGNQTAENIRTQAANLLKRSEQIHTPEQENVFLAELTKLHRELFAEEEFDSMEIFRTQADATLAEIRDALPLLLKQTTIPLPLLPGTADKLHNTIAKLETDLSHVETNIDLTLWLAELRTVSDTLATEVPLPTLDLLKEDFALLLTRFETYLASVKEASIDISRTETDLAELRGNLEDVRTYNGFEELIIRFEQTLGTLGTAPALKTLPAKNP